MTPLSQQPLFAWAPVDTVCQSVGTHTLRVAERYRGQTDLALGLCLPLRAKPIRQRGLDRILNLERVDPTQPWRVFKLRDGRTHARPPRDSGRIDMLRNSIGERLLSDAKSFRSYAFEMPYE